jgi:hypothetical protein
VLAGVTFEEWVDMGGERARQAEAKRQAEEAAAAGEGGCPVMMLMVMMLCWRLAVLRLEAHHSRMAQQGSGTGGPLLPLGLRLVAGGWAGLGRGVHWWRRPAACGQAAH